MDNTRVTLILNAVNNAKSAVRAYQKDLQDLNQTVNNTVALTSQMNGQSSQATSLFSNASKTLAKTAGIMLTLRRSYTFLKGAVKESGSWIENINLFGAAFKGSAEDVYKNTMKIADAFAVSSNEIIQYTALFKQMASAIGMTDDASTALAESLTALGYDISALYNISVEAAMEKLQAGIAGQTKPLRSLGLDITAQSLNNYLEKNGAGFTSTSLDQSSKMLLRAAVVIEQATNAYGHMAKEINNVNSQMKVMEGSFANFKLAIGDLVVGPVATAITYISGLLIAITDIIRAFVPLQEVGGEAFNEITKDVEDSTEAVNNFLGLFSFDKFEALTKGDSTAMGDLAETAKVTELFYKEYEQYMEAFNKSIENISNNAKEVAESIKKWIFPNGLNTEAESFLDILKQINPVLQLGASLVVGISGIKVASSAIDLYQKAKKAVIALLKESKDVGGSAAAVSASLAGSGTVAIWISAAITLTALAIYFDKKARQLADEMYKNSEIGQALTILGEKISATQIKAESVNIVITEAKASIKKIVADQDNLSRLLNDIFSLDSIKNKTTDELAVLNGLIETYNRNVPEMAQITLDENGNIEQTHKELLQILDDLEKVAIKQAAMDSLVALYKERFELLKSYEEAVAAIPDKPVRSDFVNGPYDSMAQANRDIKLYERAVAEYEAAVRNLVDLETLLKQSTAEIAALSNAALTGEYVAPSAASVDVMPYATSPSVSASGVSAIDILTGAIATGMSGGIEPVINLYLDGNKVGSSIAQNSGFLWEALRIQK